MMLKGCSVALAVLCWPQPKAEIGEGSAAYSPLRNAADPDTCIRWPKLG